MALKIKKNELRKLLIDIKITGFDRDGCDCGEYTYQLGKDVYLVAYRSCRKSSSTPGNDRWYLHDICFVKKIYWGEEYNDDIKNNELNIKLDKYQEKVIRTRLRRKSILETRGNEKESFGSWW